MRTAELRTERLLLRRLRAEDLPTVTEIQGDREANRHNPLGTASPARIAQQLRCWVADWAEHGIGYWLVVDAASEGAVGIGGLRRIEHDGEPALNLFYRFRPAAWGRGLALEMARAAVGWAERRDPGVPVVVITTRDNLPSIRLAERLGFREAGRDPYWLEFRRW
ncbi:GNAT family N-acetyltransferase [Kutzneria buriramensis]|uniref:RimJ/RimL family protein N-acetyltransferase n=1 Tax=Kutzneria buriramensis TaxID=1045776 RepID=A0A3E0HAI0_9PSEU|nr:GNAT family N-acetyltransferase [Kutzneria buriramensis]REH41043.1 RimJ/RimL family protein N-acetyltransferase [Kutzneria buriramensis]